MAITVSKFFKGDPGILSFRAGGRVREGKRVK